MNPESMSAAPAGRFAGAHRNFMNFLHQPLLVLALVAGGLAGCSSISVQTDHDPSTKFATYPSYTLSPSPQGLAPSPSGDTALRGTLRTELAARGITEAAAGQPADLEIVSHVFAHEETSVEQYTQWGYVSGPGGRWPYRRGSYTMWVGAPVTYTDVRNYTHGTLMLDFIDARTHRLVFRGTGAGSVGSPRANARSIEKAVEKIISRLPQPSVP
jgi:hypothetical protein